MFYRRINPVSILGKIYERNSLLAFIWSILVFAFHGSGGVERIEPLAECGKVEYNLLSGSGLPLFECTSLFIGKFV